MLEHKHYMDIDNLNTAMALKFKPGDNIIIQEKIDGANASFQYDINEQKLICFSRNKVLSQSNTLRGYYEWVQTLDKDKFHEILGDNLRVFGEWLVKHTVEYPKECYEKFYCFDIFDTETKSYLKQSEVENIAEKLGINYVPVFFEGEFTCWEDYEQLVGQTKLGGEVGEGIVIKNLDSLNGNILYTKIVDERFRETHKRPPKPVNMELVHKRQHFIELTKTIVTRQRVEKILHKCIDEGIIPENYSKDDYKTIFKTIPSAVYHDCIKEESETVNQIENFGKYSGSITTSLIKEILAEKEY